MKNVRVKYLLTVIYLFSLPLKHKSVKLLCTIRSLLRDNLVYKLEKSKIEIEVAVLRLSTLFIVSVTFYCSALPKKC